MSTGYLPKAITKEILFKRAQERFQEWCKMYADLNVSAQWMYEDMAASCYCGCPADDFPDEGEPVHQEFIDAARDYIKIHHITKEMQEVQA